MALEAKLNGVKVKCKEEVKSTLRFDINLDNPTDVTSNEVNYSELLHEKTHKHKKDELEPFEKDEDAEVAAMAKRLEEKYALPPKKARKVREEDLVDLGDGYDLNDPFVDDTEVYEDFVPHQVDTLLGGFYINAGSLEYKKAEGTEDLPLKRKQKPSFKKQSSTPKTLLASKKIKLAKQQIATSAQRNESIKKKLSTLSKSNPKSLFGSAKSQAKSNGNKIAATMTIAGEKHKELGVVSDVGVVNEDSQSLMKESEFKVPPILPVDIPPAVETKVKEIETMVHKADGKLTVKARYAYDSILLGIESESKNLKIKTRTAIFDYLGFVMGMTRASLVNRIKRTIKKQKGTDASETPLQLLKEAIDEIMPPYVAKYEADMAEYELALKNEQELNKTFGASEENIFQSPLGIKTPLDNIAKPKKPRRIVKWTPKFKSLICDVVRQKVEMELANKTSTASGEEVILDFLQTTIKPLWPKGWFVKRSIYNIAQSVHSELTGYDPQKKVTIKKDKPVETDDGSVLSLPPPLLSTQVLPPFEGSTQASFGAIIDSFPDLKHPVTTPTVSSVGILSPKGTKSFEGINKDPTVIPTSPITVTSSPKPTLMPMKRFMSPNATSGADEKQKVKIILPKQSTSKSEATLPPHSPTPNTAPKSLLNTNTITQSPTSISAVAMPTVRTATPITSHAKVSSKVSSKNPLKMVIQKGQTKVAKITAPNNLSLSQKEIDAIINTLRMNPAVSLSPQQQLHVVVQQNSPTPKVPKVPSNSQKLSSGMVTNLAKLQTLTSSQAPVKKLTGSTKSQKPQARPVVTGPGPVVTGPRPGPGPVVTGPRPGLGPVVTGPRPVVTGPGPVVTGPGPVVTGPRPVVTGPRPVVTGPRPVVTGLGPVVTGPRPVVTGPGPVVTGLGPVVTGHSTLFPTIMTSHASQWIASPPALMSSSLNHGTVTSPILKTSAPPTVKTVATPPNISSSANRTAFTNKTTPLLPNQNPIAILPLSNQPVVVPSSSNAVGTRVINTTPSKLSNRVAPSVTPTRTNNMMSFPPPTTTNNARLIQVGSYTLGGVPGVYPPNVQNMLYSNTISTEHNYTPSIITVPAYPMTLPVSHSVVTSSNSSRTIPGKLYHLSDNNSDKNT